MSFSSSCITVVVHVGQLTVDWLICRSV